MLDHIFIDLDGVLCDFTRPAMALHGKSDLVDSWPAGVYDACAVLRCKEADFWAPIHKAGEVWWATLPRHEWALDLVDLCLAKAGGVTLATSPSHHPSSVSGKLYWVLRELPSFLRKTMVGPDKHLFADCDRVLIDDCDANCAKFRKHGGQAIVFPQPWNSQHANARSAGSRLAYVRDELVRATEFIHGTSQDAA